MKNVFLIVPNLRLGGQEKVAVLTAELLKDAFHVTVITFDHREAAYSWEGELIDLKVPARPSKIGKVLNILKRAGKLRRLRKERNVDICYSFGESANIVNALSRGQGKTVVSIHGYADLKNRAADRLIYRRSDVVICCAGEIEKTYRAFFPRFSNSALVHNPYDIETIKRLSREEVPDFPPFKKVIVSHGRLEEVKNYKRLILAFSILKKEFEDAALLIVGEGSGKEELLRLAEELEIKDAVFFPGFRANPFSYLKKASVYALSSYNEGFPNGLAEGMIFLPVVSADCKSGPAEMLGAEETPSFYPYHARYGILVQNEERGASEAERRESAVCLAEAISELLREEALYEKYRKAAEKRVLDFSQSVYREKLIQLFS